MATDFWSAPELEDLTGIPQSTWRYWASVEVGPKSFKLGRRRVWRRSDVLAWIAESESVSAKSAEISHQSTHSKGSCA